MVLFLLFFYFSLSFLSSFFHSWTCVTHLSSLITSWYSGLRRHSSTFFSIFLNNPKYSFIKKFFLSFLASPTITTIIFSFYFPSLSSSITTYKHFFIFTISSIFTYTAHSSHIRYHVLTYIATFFLPFLHFLPSPHSSQTLIHTSISILLIYAYQCFPSTTAYTTTQGNDICNKRFMNLILQRQ